MLSYPYPDLLWFALRKANPIEFDAEAISPRVQKTLDKIPLLTFGYLFLFDPRDVRIVLSRINDAISERNLLQSALYSNRDQRNRFDNFYFASVKNGVRNVRRCHPHRSFREQRIEADVRILSVFIVVVGSQGKRLALRNHLRHEPQIRPKLLI